MGGCDPSWAVKNATIEPLVIDNQPAMLQMQYLHSGKSLVNEDKDLTTLHVTLHQRSDNTAKGVKTFSHIHGSWI